MPLWQKICIDIQKICLAIWNFYRGKTSFEKNYFSKKTPQKAGFLDFFSLIEQYSENLEGEGYLFDRLIHLKDVDKKKWPFRRYSLWGMGMQVGAKNDMF